MLVFFCQCRDQFLKLRFLGVSRPKIILEQEIFENQRYQKKKSERLAVENLPQEARKDPYFSQSRRRA